MRPLIRTILGLTAVSVGLMPVADAASSEGSDYLADVVDEHKIPGLAATVVTRETTELEWLSGEDGNGKPVTGDTPFLIGSLAKSMTATVVLQHVDDGALQLGESVDEHLPWLVEPSPTVEELLTHTSGYSTTDGLAVAERFDNTEGAIRRAAEDLEHSGTRGEFEYSDANYLILGALIEELDGKPFGEVLRTDVLEPLGMRDTATTSDAAADLPPGHRYWWGSPRSYSPGFDESGTPFGYVTSTLADLTRYARAQLGANPDVLDPELVRRLHTPRVDADDNEYGYGWRVTPSDLGPLTHHTGATPGYFAHVLLGPDGQAVVILANAYSEARAPALAAIAENLLLLLDGQKPESVGGDPLLGAMPWVMSAVAATGLVIAVVALRRPARRGLRWTLAGFAVAMVGALWWLPSLFGSNLRVMRIWMPDAAVGLIGALVAWALATALLLIPRSAYARVATRGRSPRAGAGPRP